ncbi:hypothetical protein KWH50_21190, partial [Xanthomonas campestris pv. blepharidis]|nr:hypothetical protein [Xanthomonas campestris pv. blepharidis]
MARLAESSVVVALRDWQWETAIMEGRRPGPFLNLSGNTDKKLGDVKFSENDRLFLIEAKATENEIKEEWDRGERPRKHAHRMLDVPPILSSTSVWSPIPYPKEIGRE